MKGLKGYGFFIVMAAIILVVILSNGFFENMNREHYSYVQFQEDISNGSIRSVIIRQNQEVPTGEVVASTSDNKSKSFYVPDVRQGKAICYGQGCRNDAVVYSGSSVSVWLCPYFCPVQHD